MLPPVPLDKGSLASQVYCLYSEHKALLLAPEWALADPTTPKTSLMMSWLSMSFLEVPQVLRTTLPMAFLLPIKLSQVPWLPSEIPLVILLLPWTTLLGVLFLPKTASLMVLLLPRISSLGSHMLPKTGTLVESLLPSGTALGAHLVAWTILLGASVLSKTPWVALHLPGPHLLTPLFDFLL
jgi:hypothetical protein